MARGGEPFGPPAAPKGERGAGPALAAFGGSMTGPADIAVRPLPHGVWAAVASALDPSPPACHAGATGPLWRGAKARTTKGAMRDHGTEEASDVDLLGRVAAGDRAAFRALHDRYHGPVHGFASRILGTPERADEVAQDAMLAVWHGAARFEGRSKASTWIFGIAYRIALKARRRRGVERGAVEADAAAKLADEATPAPDAAFLHGQVRGALGELPIELRAVVVLTYYYGRSVTEVAEMIGVPPGTVKSRMHAARRRLRERLE